MIEEIGKLFGASAVASGADFGPIMACADNAVDTLDIEINSPGGSVFDGYTIFNEIQSLRDRGVVVTATITGMAASMASVICMACDSIRMVPHGRMMIHDASNVVAGNAEKMRTMADLLDGISGDIAAIYAKRTGKTTDAVRGMMKAETWMNAKDAKSSGFVDEILFGKIAENKIDSNATNVQTHVPDDMSFLQKLLAPSNEEITSQLEAVKTDLAGTEAKLQESIANIATAESALQEAATEILNLRTSGITITSELATMRTEKESLATALAESEAKATPEAIQALVTAQIAASGHPPLNVETGLEPNKTENSLTRELFNALTPAKRLAFAKAGGKIS
jgi:ATP-dependent Clp endopeptidase proteolytic subunit ClpP